MTRATNGRSFFSLFVVAESFATPLHAVPGPWRRSPLVALRARESGTPTHSGVGSLGSNGPARQDRPQDHPTSATEHERALTRRELALRAVAMGRRRSTQTGTPNDRGTTCGLLLRRARPPVPRALGASWSPPRATSRTRLRHKCSDEPCGRSLIARTASGSAARCAST